MAGPSWMRSWRRRTSLRTQVTVVAVVLAAVTVLVVAGVSAWVLRGVLLERIDDQLRAAVANLPPSQGLGLDGAGGSVEPPDGPHGAPPPVEYFGELVDADGDVIRSLTPTSADAGRPELPMLDSAAVESRGGEPFTVSGVTGGSWRVVAAPVTVGGSAGAIVYGIPVEQVSSTINQMMLIILAVASLALVGLALLARWLVGLSLRPLTEMEATTQAIAAGDLTMRVPEAPTTTEVGRLGRSFNAMLERIEASFAAQRASEEQARESEQVMRRFVADASHELRTPLTSIRGYAELHRQGAAVGGIDDTMVRIERAAERMGVLVDDLLLLARLDERRPIERRRVDLGVLAGDVVAELQTHSPDHQLRIRTSRHPVRVFGDEEELRRVLVNLVSNSCRHTGPGTTVTVVVVELDGARVRMSVTDDGEGMDSETAAHAFERFSRAEASRQRTTAVDGSGLGLAIVDAIVRAHDGTVSLTSSPGKGTTVTVELPTSAA